MLCVKTDVPVYKLLLKCVNNQGCLSSVLQSIDGAMIQQI